MNYDGSTGMGTPVTEKQAPALEGIINSFGDQLERLEKGISRLSDLGNRLEDEPTLKAEQEPKQTTKAPGRLSALSSLLDKFMYLNGKHDSQLQKLDKLL